MGRLFGTDGARGVAITELTCELAMQIGRAAALVLTKETKHRARILIGKDTRISSDILEAALCAGICSVGAQAIKLGVVPTPAVAYLVRAHGADAGVMISASHNSVEFNGIKLFAATGYKLPDAVEEEIEALILDHPEQIELQSHTNVGAILEDLHAKDNYVDYLASCVHTDCSGMRVTLDCANGSSSTTAAALFTRLGAEVHMLSAEPDGTNINRACGSTHMEHLMEYVQSHDCDLGLAFDGDADRCLAVDENGALVDGDKIIAICADAMKRNGTLKKDTAVVTVMTNLGFFHFCKANGISSVTTKVGDRYVLEEMLKDGYNLGGEQSGHIIFLDEATTGDGELSGIKLLEILKKSGKPMSELASLMNTFSQVLYNVTIPNEKKGHWQDDAEIAGQIAAYTEQLGEDGRILVRESGTEPLIRVMVEGKDAQQIETAAQEITKRVQCFAEKSEG
ncbi:MAG: phosphoglucosamine mutase [Ruminococcus sp.]|nr:phosphoglucosamine mutase [Ruminococcus sp.]